MVRCEKFRENVLPLNVDAVSHYYYLRKLYRETRDEFLYKLPSFSDLRNEVVKDVMQIWQVASLPTVGFKRIQTKLKELIAKFEGAKKRATSGGKSGASEDRLDKLFDICSCKCEIDSVKIFNGKLQCECLWKNRIPKEEISFLVDQRTERKIILTRQKDVTYCA